MTHAKPTSLILVSVFLSVFGISVANAQSTTQRLRNTDVHLSEGWNSQFVPALNVLASQAHVAFVVEGSPLTLSKGERPSGTSPPKDLAAALTQLCKAYYYDVVAYEAAKHISGIIELRKHYALSCDLPDVTSDECFESLKDAKVIMSSVVGNTSQSWEQITNDAFNSLTKEQLSEASGKGLPVGTLNASQYDAFSQVAKYFYVSARQSALNECYQLLLHANTLSVFRDERRGKSTLQISFRDNIGTIKRPLLGSVPGIRFEPPPTSRDLPDLQILFTRKTPTIAEVLAELPDAKLYIQPSLMQKSVYMVGARFSTLGSIIRAVADVYGIRYMEDAQGHRAIRRPVVSSGYTYSNFYSAINHVLPLPLVDAITPSDELEQFRKNTATFEQSIEIPVKRDRDRQKSIALRDTLIRQSKDFSQRTSQIANECVRRIDFAFEVKSRGRSGYKASLAELGPEAQQCFAILVMAGFIDRMNKVSAAGMPLYVKDFDRSVVSAGQSQKEKWIELSRVEPSGALIPMVQMSVIIR